jgi:hypothetical protein
VAVGQCGRFTPSRRGKASRIVGDSGPGSYLETEAAPRIFDTLSGSSFVLLDANRAPVPKPTAEHNRCKLGH